MSLSSVSGSFHQGCVEMFGPNSGKQCSCIALYSIAYSTLKSLCRWSSNDLDIIVVNGNQVFKKVNIDNHLMVSELPLELYIGKCKINVSYSDFPNVGVLKTDVSMLPDLIHNLTLCPSWNGSLFFIKGFCFSIMTENDYFYIFDSHSRDSVGLPCSEGASVLLKFESVEMVADFL